MAEPKTQPDLETMQPGFEKARQDFLAHLRYSKGYSTGTCYGYNSDLGIWARWLLEAGRDWRSCTHVDVEHFTMWQIRDRGAKVQIVSRRSSCLSSFYRWAMKNQLVESDPVYLADKPKRPHRMPVWLEKEEQAALEQAVRTTENLKDNIFGRKPEHIKEIRERYEMLFLLLLNSGLRINEALSLRVRDVSISNGVAVRVRVIGKGNKERSVPLPAKFGQVFGFWLRNRHRDEFVFAREPGGKPPGAQAARAYLRRLREKAGIEKNATPHKLRHTYATRLLEKGAQLADIQALLGHADITTTAQYTHASDDRMRFLVDDL